MLLQEALNQRIILVLIAQIWPIFYCSYFVYKILNRAKNRATYTLSSLFISLSLSFFLASLSILLNYTPFAYVLFITGIYFFFFTHSLFVIFTWVLVRLDDKSPHWKFYLGIMFYGIISSFVFWIGFFLQGIRLDSSTEWIPIYSWFFMSISWTLLFIFVIIPQIYLSLKLRKVFEGIILKRRINMYIVSVFLELSMVFALFLYNAWIENTIYRTYIYPSIFPIIGTIAAFLIYKSFGKELE
jgi:hypothetical protein